MPVFIGLSRLAGILGPGGLPSKNYVPIHRGALVSTSISESIVFFSSEIRYHIQIFPKFVVTEMNEV